PQKQYVAGSVKFWQSGGMLHLDLGSSFANAGNVVLEVRDLKGRFVLRQDINEQVSSVRLESGVFAITVRGAGISKNAVVMVR
ncbi:MAG: hypothetical protein FWH22_07890, partial [Fibromonadales bacterium]|nr:hypothetical protein [Fibromonadales bacterium]